MVSASDPVNRMTISNAQLLTLVDKIHTMEMASSTKCYSEEEYDEESTRRDISDEDHCIRRWSLDIKGEAQPSTVS